MTTGCHGESWNITPVSGRIPVSGDIPSRPEIESSMERPKSGGCNLLKRGWTLLLESVRVSWSPCHSVSVVPCHSVSVVVRLFIGTQKQIIK